MQHEPFTQPKAAFTRSVPIRFSHCDPAGIVYFPHYFNVFNGLIEDWYTEELGYNYAEIMGSQFGIPFVHIECDFKVPSRMGDVIDLTLLVERIGREEPREIILATNPNAEGEATALYLSRLLQPLGVVVSRLAYGLPIGGDLDYADEITLAKALEGRTTL